MTTDEIMALADQYGMRAVKVSQGERPIDTSKYRAALRAAVEQIERERDEARALLKCVADNLEKGMSKSMQELQARTIRQELK